MKEEVENRFYEDQVPELLGQMKRIADALERLVSLEEEREEKEQQKLQASLTLKEGQREQRRKRFETQIKKLAEVDRMARDLRRKLEEKQAAEAAAKAEAEGKESATDSTGGETVADKSSVPTDN